MKKRFLMLMLLIASTTVSLMAQGYDYKQDPKYGNTPEEREHNVTILNYFNDACQMKTYDDAANYLRELMASCPQASENIFIKGGEIYRNKLSRAKTKADRFMYLDSMMYIYDQRVITYGDHDKRGKSYILNLKAQDFYVYAPGETARAFGYFRDAVNAASVNHDLDPDMAKVFFNALTENYKLGDITPDDYMRDYELVAGELALMEQNEEVVDATNSLETLFAQSGAASCENIEKIYRPRYEADPNNVDLMKKIAGLLSRSKCTSDFQMALLENYYKVEPTPEVALLLAGLYEDRQDHGKAIEYINIAIKNETDATKRTGYIIRAAAANLANNNFRSAADLAKQAIAAAPDNGFGYLLYASALASGASSACSGFDRQAAYWLVVDAYQQARSKFSDDPAQLSNINQAIGSLSANFPKTEDTFLRNLSPGDGYTVNCGWISGRTTVRER